MCDGPTDRPTDGRTNGRTDWPTDGRTDTPSYRDARTHLKRTGKKEKLKKKEFWKSTKALFIVISVNGKTFAVKLFSSAFHWPLSNFANECLSQNSSSSSGRGILRRGVFSDRSLYRVGHPDALAVESMKFHVALSSHRLSMPYLNPIWPSSNMVDEKILKIQICCE